MSKLGIMLGALRKSSGIDLKDQLLAGAKAGAEQRFRKLKAKGKPLNWQYETLQVINNRTFMSAMREQGIGIEDIRIMIKDAYNTVNKEQVNGEN